MAELSNIAKRYSPQLLKQVIKGQDSYQDLLIKNDGYKFAICPFTIITGAQNSTEAGYKPENSIPVDYTSFSKVFNGQDSVIVNWDNSTELTQEKPNEWKKALGVGVSFYGLMSDNSAQVSFNPSTINSEMVQQSIARSFTLVCDTFPTLDNEGNYKMVKRPFGNNDLFKLYQILEVSDNTPLNQVLAGDYNETTRTNRQWFFVSSVTNVYATTDSKAFIYSKITFTSLNDTLNKSGRAIDQYIHLGGAGEGYAFPIIQNGLVVMDEANLYDLPVTHCQIDIIGAAPLYSICAYGRPANRQEIDTNKYTRTLVAPRKLWPYSIHAPITDPLLLNNLPARDFVILTGTTTETTDANPNANLSAVIGYDNWQSKVQSMFNQLQQRDYFGAIDTNFAYTTQTNPINSKTNKYFPLWDETWTFQLKGKASMANCPYWVDANGWGENKTNGYIFDYSTYTSWDIRYLMVFNDLAGNHVTTLPWSTKENIHFALRDIPLIGRFLNDLTLGIPIGWNFTNSTNFAPCPPLNCIFPAHLYETLIQTMFGEKTQGSSGYLYCNAFMDNESNGLTTLLGANSYSTSFCFELTDQIGVKATNVSDGTLANLSETINTSQLGQTGFNYIDGSIDNTKRYLANSTIRLQNSLNGFLIDAINFKTPAECNVKITFYSSLTPDGNVKPLSPNSAEAVWVGYVRTRAKQTHNITNWDNTIIISSYGIQNTYKTQNTKFYYPQQLVVKKPTTNDYSLTYTFDAKSTFNISGDAQSHELIFSEFTIGINEVAEREVDNIQRVYLQNSKANSNITFYFSYIEPASGLTWFNEYGQTRGVSQSVQWSGLQQDTHINLDKQMFKDTTPTWRKISLGCQQFQAADAIPRYGKDQWARPKMANLELFISYQYDRALNLLHIRMSIDPKSRTNWFPSPSFDPDPFVFPWTSGTGNLGQAQQFVLASPVPASGQGSSFNIGFDLLQIDIIKTTP